MGKLFGIVLLVLGIWLAVEVYTEGVNGAFGGVFASGSADQAPVTQSTSSRAADTVRSAYEESVNRVDRQLEGEAPNHD